ncbi:MAG: RagB/SusD family nutrient uptake outer membrane protein [Lutibacter sp.]|nr:MAG: RagB/SusD family nutrient uptake outer membrane protein [Lutibacter sp.]
MKNIFKKLIFVVTITLFMTSCQDDLNLSPIDPDSFTQEDVFASANDAQGALAKLYASLALTGQEGPAGQPDIGDIDEGFSQFSRMLFNLNVLTTDEAVVGWGDPGLPDLHGMSWSSSNDFTEAMYSRLAQVVSFSNSFIKNAALLNESTEVQYYIAEARFLRAYAYYNLMDLYANVPLTSEISTDLPLQSNRTEIFAFVETELLEIQDLLKSGGGNEYGRVDQVAAWALLSKLYLNAEVWISEAKYTECVTFSNNVMNSSYSINMNDANGNGTAYDELFLADNDTNGAQNEFIFALNFDGLQSQTYGGTTFLVHAAIGGTMNAEDFGVNGGWGGLRTTKSLVNKFASEDQRGMFHTDGQSLEIEKIPPFKEGYGISKFKNVDSNGNAGSDTGGDFVDTDLPLIRLAEIYLNYAEATVRGGGGNLAIAADKINELRERAYGNNSGNISSGDLNLDFILNERSRELYWEGQRRTDLVRYNYFTSNSYLWPFKGNVPNGTSVGQFRNIFPLPINALSTNHNLTQNVGY